MGAKNSAGGISQVDVIFKDVYYSTDVKRTTHFVQ